MEWATSNAREPKGNAILVTKQASGSAKIDPSTAAFNAIALMSTNPMAHFSQPGIFGCRCWDAAASHSRAEQFPELKIWVCETPPTTPFLSKRQIGHTVAAEGYCDRQAD